MRAILGRWTWDLESGPDRMRQSTREALRANEAMLEQVNGNRGGSGGLVAAWPLLLGFGTCSEELIRGAKALADRHGVGWGMMHLASHPARKTRDRLPLATLDGWGVLGPNAKLSHMVYLDDADIKLLARRGVKISHCPTAGLKHTKGLAAHARVPEMIARGVCVSLGGDSGNGSNHFDMLRMMYLVATIYKDARLDVTVMPPETVLEMATIRGAESLLMERRIGSLEPAVATTWSSTTAISRVAAAQPLNNLVYAATGSSVRSVMIDGAWSSTTAASPRWTSGRSTSGWRCWRGRRCGAPVTSREWPLQDEPRTPCGQRVAGRLGLLARA